MAQPESVNSFATKKTGGAGLLDLGLIMTNVSMLKSLIGVGPDGEDLYYPLLVLISITLLLQVFGVIFLGKMGATTIGKDIKSGESRLNNVTQVILSAVGVLNFIIGVIGVQ